MNSFLAISGWWLSHPSEKYEFVNWDDEIPNIYIYRENNNWQPNHQPDFQWIPQRHDTFCPSSNTLILSASRLSPGHAAAQTYGRNIVATGQEPRRRAARSRAKLSGLSGSGTSLREGVNIEWWRSDFDDIFPWSVHDILVIFPWSVHDLPILHGENSPWFTT